MIDRMPRTLELEPYTDQVARWPRWGRHILAQYDERTIVVYQAYKPSIGTWATLYGKLGGPEFGLGRMSWIKPNFLWMMYRSGWASQRNQESVLAIRIGREAFDQILAAAVPSSPGGSPYPTKEAWQSAVASSEVRLQWDPDHAPDGPKLERRAIQLGLRGEMLRRFAQRWIVEVEDITPFVQWQSQRLRVPYAGLLTPREEVYLPGDPEIVRRVLAPAERRLDMDPHLTMEDMGKLAQLQWAYEPVPEELQPLQEHMSSCAECSDDYARLASGIRYTL
jgi:hypothetical protein